MKRVKKAKSAEWYEKLTGQRIGSLTGQSTSTVTNIDTTHTN